MRAGGALYVGLLVFVTAFVIGLWLLLSGDRGWALVVAILAIGPASSLAVAIVNRAVTRSIGPRHCPGSIWTTACRPRCERSSPCRCC